MLIWWLANSIEEDVIKRNSIFYAFHVGYIDSKLLEDGKYQSTRTLDKYNEILNEIVPRDRSP